MALGRPVTLSPNVASKTVSITATAGQTLFEPSGGYRINEIAVYRNGTRLVNGQDFTARDGATVLLVSGATLNDVLEFQIFDSFNIANTIKPNEATQTITGELVVDGGIIGAVLGIQSAGSLVGTARTVNFIGSGNTVVDNGDGTINVSISGETAGIDTSATSEFTNISVSGIATVGSAVTINSTGIDAVSGVITASSFVGNVTGNASGTAGGLTGTPDITVRNITGVAATFTGAVTYEDVTNVDSIGIVTARGGLEIGAAGVGGTITSAGAVNIIGISTFESNVEFGQAGVGGTIRANGDTTLVGVLTATKIVVNENSAFNDADEYLLVKNTGAACNLSVVGGTGNHSSVNLGDTDDFNIQKIRSGHTDNSLAFFTNNLSRLHLDNAGRIGINTATFGDAREALRIQSPTGQTGTFLTILANEGGSSQIFFGDNDFNEGRIDYDHSTNTMGLYTNDSERLLVNDAGVVVTGISSDSKGDLRSIPLQDESGSGGTYTLVASDAGQCVHIHGTTTGVTVNDSTFSAGDAVTIVNGSGGTMALTQGSCTIRYTADSSTGSKTLASFAMCTLWFSGHNVAYLSGAGLS